VRQRTRAFHSGRRRPLNPPLESRSSSFPHPQHRTLSALLSHDAGGHRRIMGQTQD
jgi:hypothetical protein